MPPNSSLARLIQKQAFIHTSTVGGSSSSSEIRITSLGLAFDRVFLSAGIV